MTGIPDPWPLRRLVLRTPRLELRPDDDEGLLELVDEAYRGIHPSETMPFTVPWTDTPRARLGQEIMQYHWSQRHACKPDDWRINFLVRRDGRVIGTQGITGKDFAVARAVHTGSWLGMRHQGTGLGTEMRAAVLMFAFDHLGAVQARSDAFTDNPRSLRVSEKLGYLVDGTERVARRGAAATLVRLLLTASRFAEIRPDWRLDVTGLTECRPVLGSFPDDATAAGEVDG